MIIQSLCDIVFFTIAVIINVLPTPVLNLVDGTAGLTTILAYGLFFFPADIWACVITMGVMMLTTGLVWAVIEWVYKKIPGVD